MTLRIDVIQADIDAALRTPYTGQLQHCCPVAQALKRMFPTECVSVGCFGFGLGCFRYHARGENSDIMGTITSLGRNSWSQAKPVSFVVTQEYIP